MLTRSTLFSLLAGASAVAAQTSTTSIFFGNLSPQGSSGDDGASDPNDSSTAVVASVVAADPTATTFAIGCQAPAGDDSCDLPPVTITANPSLFQISSTTAASDYFGEDSMTGAVTLSSRCELDNGASTKAVCTWFEGGDFPAEDSSQADFMMAPMTETLSARDITWMQVTITAGLEKLSADSSASTTTEGAAPGSTGASSSGASATSVSGMVTATASHSGSAAPASQTGNSAMSVGVSSGLFIPFAALFGYLLA